MLLARLVGEKAIKENEYNKLYLDTYNYMKEHDKLYGKMGNNCFLREEGKKIWIYDDISSKEFLLYDFGLEVGDSLPCIFGWNGYGLSYDNIHPGYYPDTIVVTAIKERTLDNGKTYKEWVFDYGAHYVEGLGYIGGFLKGRIWEAIPTRICSIT